MIRILLVDDQKIMCERLKALLEPSPKLKVVGVTQDGYSAIQQVRDLQPDIVLMDIEMSGMSGLIATDKINQQFPETKVIILSSHADKKYLVEGLKVGAKGYLLKTAQIEDVEQVIWLVSQGYSQIESQLLGELWEPDSSVLAKSGTLKESASELNQSQYFQNGSSPKMSGTDLKQAVSSVEPKVDNKETEKSFVRGDYVENQAATQHQKSGSPKFSKSRILKLIAISALSIASIIFFYSRANKNSAQPVAEVQTVPRSLSLVGAVGYLEPQGEVINVSPPIFQEGAKVEQLLVKRGDRVKVGQVVATLDNQGRLQAALKQAQAQVNVAKFRLDQVKAGAKKGEIQAQTSRFLGVKAELAGQISTQEASIANLKAQLEGQTNSQEANIARLKAELDNASRECQRYEQLLADGAIAISERDRICLQQVTTQKQLRVAEVSLIEIKATLQQQISQAQANLRRTKTTLTNQIREAEASLEAISEVRPVDVAVAQSELTTAVAAVNRAEAELELAFVKSPITGQILEINSWPGEIVDNNRGLVVMGNTDSMYAVAQVYETDINSIRIGQGATVTSGGITEKLTGTVEAIGWQIGTKDFLGTDPVADADARVINVKIRLDNADSERVTNLTNLEVDVTIDTSENAV